MEIVLNKLDKYNAQLIKNIVSNCTKLIEAYNGIKSIGIDDVIVHMGGNHISILSIKTKSEIVKIVNV